MTTITDNFDRANANPIGAPWSTVTGGANLQIVSNRVRGTSTTIPNTARHTTALATRNHYSQARVYFTTSTSAVSANVATRVSTSTHSYYSAGKALEQPDVVNITRCVNGFWTTIGQAGASLPVGGSKVFRLESNGLTHRLYVDGNLTVGPVTDAIASPHPQGLDTNPYVGLHLWAPVLANTEYDDFTGGDLPPPFADGFDRADAAASTTALGPDWTQGAYTFRVSSGRAGPGGTGDRYAIWNGSIGSNDQHAQLRPFWSTSGNEAAPIVRCDAGLTQFYAATTGYGTNERIVRRSGGSFTVLASTGIPPTSGATYRIIAVGTALYAQRNGFTILGPVTDATLSSGSAGMFLYAATSVGHVSADDWSAGVGSVPPAGGGGGEGGGTGQAVVKRYGGLMHSGTRSRGRW
jgi:hypothetical protein